MYIGKTRNPFLIILFTYISCGFYQIYWVYQISKDINGITGQERINPVYYVLSSFIPWLPFYFAYKVDQNLVEIAETEHTEYKTNFVLWIILSFALGIGYVIYMYQAQEALNKVWANRSQATPI
jgi:nitrate reductase NapE component